MGINIRPGHPIFSACLRSSDQLGARLFCQLLHPTPLHSTVIPSAVAYKRCLCACPAKGTCLFSPQGEGVGNCCVHKSMQFLYPLPLSTSICRSTACKRCVPCAQ